MKTLLKLTVAAALIASASAAFACGMEGTKTAEAQSKATKPAAVAKAEKKAVTPAKAAAEKQAAPAVATR